MNFLEIGIIKKEYKQNKDAFFEKAISDLKKVFPEEEKFIGQFERTENRYINNNNKVSEIVENIWTEDSPIYREINKALFLDIFTTAFSESNKLEMPSFMKGNEEIDYKFIIKHSFRYKIKINIELINKINWL